MHPLGTLIRAGIEMATAGTSASPANGRVPVNLYDSCASCIATTMHMPSTTACDSTYTALRAHCFMV